MSQTLRTLLAIGLVAVPAAIFAAKNTTPTTTSTVYDNATSGAQLLMRSDDFDGSGFATYGKPRTSTKGNTTSQDNSSSGFDANGWVITWSSPRKLFITPNQPVGVQPPPTVPLPSANFYSWAGQAHSICRTPAGAVIPFASLGTGIQYSCQLGVEFHYPDQSSGAVYKLVMGPALPWGGPSTGVANVQCNSIASNQCANWTITSGPDANGQNTNVANLYYYDGGSATWVFIGQYYNSFRIGVVTNP